MTCLFLTRDITGFLCRRNLWIRGMRMRISIITRTRLISEVTLYEWLLLFHWEEDYCCETSLKWSPLCLIRSADKITPFSLPRQDMETTKDNGLRAEETAGVLSYSNIVSVHPSAQVLRYYKSSFYYWNFSK